MSNEKRNNSTYLILGGIAAGAALGYFLNTKRGRQLTKSLADQGISLKDNVVEKGADLGKRAKTQMNDVIDSAKEVASNTLDTLKTQAETVSSSAKTVMASATDTTFDKVEKSIDQVESAANSLKKGVKRAKNKLNGALEA